MAKDAFELQLERARIALEQCVLAGTDSAVESVLNEFTDISQHEDAVVDLIYNEHLIREEQGDSPTIDEYLQRFPQFESRIKRLFNIHTSLESGELSRGGAQHGVPASSRSRRLRPGDWVGPYELIKHLGHGGKGVVFQARRAELDRMVALKILKHDLSGENEIGRFLAEAKSAAKLQHPNIVQVFATDIYDEFPYIALEYVSGGTLDDKVAERPLAGREAAELMVHVAGAMEYAHRNGVVHRDLKPSNILVTDDGIPKITDFGLAKRSSIETGGRQSLTESGLVVGTPSYMAPEQAAGRNRIVGPKSDVYGLGAVLYQLLTGQPPFVGESTLDTLQNIQSLEPVAPSRLNPKVPRDLETICLKCLEKEPRRRYESAAELAADLQRFCSGRSIVARPTNIVHRTAKLAKRHPVVSFLATALVLSIAAAFWIVSWQWKQAAAGQRAEAALRDATERSLYAQQIGLAQNDIRSSECARALGTLESSDPNLRHWELDYLARRCESHIPLAELGKRTRRCVVSPDGKMLAVVRGKWGTDELGSLAVIDVEKRQLLYHFDDDFGPLMDVAFSVDSSTIVTVSSRFEQGGGQIAFWKAESGNKVRSIDHEGGLHGVAVHPSKQLIAVASSNGSVEMWDAETDERLHLLTGHQDNCFKVAFRPDGSQLASASRDGTVILWDVESAESTGRLQAPTDVRTVAYTPDSRYLAINGYDQAVQLWDLLPSPPRRIKVHIGGAQPTSYTLSISPKGRFITTIGDLGKRFFMYDMATGDLNVRASETPARTFWIAHHPQDGRMFLVDADGKTLEAASPQDRLTKRIVVPLSKRMAWSHDDRWIAVTSGHCFARPGLRDYSLRLIDRSSPQLDFRLLEGADTWSSAVVFTRDTSRLVGACDDGSILCWDVESAELVSKVQAHDNRIVCLSEHPSTEELVSFGAKGIVRTWSLMNDQLQERPSHEFQLPISVLTAVCTSRDGEVFAAAADDGRVEVFAWAAVADRHRSIARLDRNGQSIAAMAISDDGTQLAIATEDKIEHWQLEDRVVAQANWQIATTAHSIIGLGFHPNGKRLAIIDGWNGRANLVDTFDGQIVMGLDTRSGVQGAQIDFSADGKSLLAVLGGELHMWNSAAPSPTESAAQQTKQVRSSADLWYEFEWHVRQANEGIHGELYSAAEFHARHALAMSDDAKPGREFQKNLIYAKVHLAKTLIETGRGEEGKNLLEQTITECPNDIYSLGPLVYALTTYPGELLIDSTRMVELSERARTLRPENSDFWGSAGIAYLKHGELKKAREHLEEGAQLATSRKSLAWFALCVLDASEGNLQAAEANFERASKWLVNYAPDDPVMQSLRRWARGSFDEAGSGN